MDVLFSWWDYDEQVPVPGDPGTLSLVNHRFQTEIQQTYKGLSADRLGAAIGPLHLPCPVPVISPRPRSQEFFEVVDGPTLTLRNLSRFSPLAQILTTSLWVGDLGVILGKDVPREEVTRAEAGRRARMLWEWGRDAANRLYEGLGPDLEQDEGMRLEAAVHAVLFRRHPIPYKSWRGVTYNRYETLDLPRLWVDRLGHCRPLHVCPECEGADQHQAAQTMRHVSTVKHVASEFAVDPTELRRRLVGARTLAKLAE